VERLKKIANDVAEIKLERDHFAHGIWTIGERKKKKFISVYVQKEDGAVNMKDVTLEFLQKRIVEISAISRRIMAVSNAGGPFGRDCSFPIPDEETAVIRSYLNKYLRPPVPFVIDN